MARTANADLSEDVLRSPLYNRDVDDPLDHKGSTAAAATGHMGSTYCLITLPLEAEESSTSAAHWISDEGR